MKERFSLFLLTAAILLPSIAQAEFYLRPRVGATFAIDGGDTAYSVGAAAGFWWNKYLATEISYSRLIGSGSAPDGDLIRGEGIVSYPLPVATPFVSGGFGASHVGGWDPMILAGGGVSLNALAPFFIEGGFSYAAVFGRPDFIEPYAAVGIGF